MPSLHDTLVVERATEGDRDEYGNPTQAWATVATIPGLVQQKNARELAQLSQAGPVTSLHKAFLEYGADVAEADRIVVAGRTFQVTGVDPDVGGARHHAYADLQLVEIPMAKERVLGRDKQRIAVGAGKGVTKRFPDGTRVEFDTDPAMLAILDGLVAAGRRIVETADVPDAEPFGQGLVTSGGVVAYAFGKVTHAEGTDRKLTKPRGFRTNKAGVDVIVGFGFPGAFQETGTVHHDANPFLGPAMASVADEIPAILREHFPDDGP